MVEETFLLDTVALLWAFMELAVPGIGMWTDSGKIVSVSVVSNWKSKAW